MAEKEDDFDFDIYGDDSAQTYEEADQQPTDANAVNAGEAQYDEAYQAQDAQVGDESYQMTEDTQTTAAEGQEGDQHYDASAGLPNASEAMQSDQVQQGTKRKSGDDAETPIDPAATSALSLSELNWWTSEDEIRGWANECGVEDQMKELTFNEHKVNGKSKGQVGIAAVVREPTSKNEPQAFIEFASAAAATAVKHRIESLDTKDNFGKKFIATYHAPNMNPYKNPPKDVAGRKDHGPGNRNASGHMGQNPRGGMNSFGGRGNYQNRGGMGFQNRNYNQGMNMNMGGGFGGNMGFQSGMNPMGNFGNFNRGGMMGGMRGGMGGRGGRGGMGGGFNPMMGMGGMGMGMPNMPMGMGMGNMGGMMNPFYPPFQPLPYGIVAQDPYSYGLNAENPYSFGFTAQDASSSGFTPQHASSHGFIARQPGASIPTHIGRPRRPYRWPNRKQDQYKQYTVTRKPQTPVPEQDRRSRDSSEASEISQGLSKSEISSTFQGGVKLAEAQTEFPHPEAISAFQGGVKLSAALTTPYKPLEPPQDCGYAAPSNAFGGQYPGFTFAVLYNIN